MKVSVNDILGSLFNPEETVCFRVFDDKKRGTFSGAKMECECRKYAEIEGKLKSHNAWDRGVFFVVNYGGHEDASITRINAHFVEMDHGSMEEQQKKVDAFPLTPSMVIQTAKSLHVYWFTDKEAKVEQFRMIQKQLVKHFDGDPACVNESRVLRLPNFNHCKNEPVEVVCKSFHPEYRYSQNQLSEALPEIEETTYIEKKNGTEKGIAAVIHTCDFIQHCQKNAATLSEPEWFAMITNLIPFDGGTDMIHQYSMPYPSYSESKTQKKINYTMDKGIKPITCQTICERGFPCPKFLSGGCGVKAPAALCYKPLEMDVLQKILDDLPVTEETMKDLQTAKKFIIDCLFNQDAITADYMINTAIPDHFDLKKSQTKSLSTVYKEVSKTYKSSKSAKRAKLSHSLPDWYEPAENGLRFLPGVLATNLVEKENVFFAAEQYYQYQDGVYTEMTEMKAQSIVQKKMLPSETKMSHIVDAERQWRLLVQKDIRELNPNPYIINIKNGLYNVLEDTVLPHNPNYFSTVQLNVKYDQNAECPLFRKYLEESVGGDMEQVALIQEMLGYFLIPVTSAQKCFLIVGAARAGKSVLLRVLNDILLGAKNVSNVSWQALNEPYKLAELFGKLANIFADLPTKNIDDNGIFKALVGEDHLTAERKYQHPFTFQATARLLFSCNSIPANYGDRSEGFYRRLIIIPFKHSVPQEKVDTALFQKFCLEANGIFLFAVEGLRRLMSNNYQFSETNVNKEELQKYREASDSMLGFVKECCELHATYSVQSTEIFNAYTSYCEENGLKAYSHPKFVRNIKTIFPEITGGRDRASGIHTLDGIRLI